MTGTTSFVSAAVAATLPQMYEDWPELWEPDFKDREEANQAFFACLSKKDMPRISYADAYARTIRRWKRQGQLRGTPFEHLSEVPPTPPTDAQ